MSRKYLGLIQALDSLFVKKKQHLANKTATYRMLLSNIFVNPECGGEYGTEQLLMWSPRQYPEFPQGGL